MTVYRLPYRCWTVVPELPREDGDPHYDTRAEALAAIREAWDEGRDWTFDDRLRGWWREVQFRLGRLRPRAPRPRQRPARCWLIQCDGCDEHIDEEDEGYIAHCDSRLDAEETMATWRWAYVGDLVFCETDAPENAAVPPPSPAEQEDAGQLRLPGVLT